MSDHYQNLIERIRGEITDLEMVVARAERSWALVQKKPSEGAYVDSVALNLHSFYSGLEKLFEMIARQVDESTPSGDMWHRELLLQMEQNLPKTRPAVISHESGDMVDELRRFRHLVRNVYTVNLTPEKMERLITVLPITWTKLRAELLAFADYLEALDAASADS